MNEQQAKEIASEIVRGWLIKPQSIKLSMAKVRFTMYDAIAGFMGIERYSLLFTSLYQTFIDRNSKVEAIKRLVFHVHGIGDMDYPSHSFDMALNQFQFYYEAILDGCTFDHHGAGIMHSEIERNELNAVAERLKERPAFLFGQPLTEPKPLDSRKETTLNCLIAVLAKKLNYSPDNADTVGKVYALLEREGVCMDKKTIRTNIKAAFSSLNERRE